MTSLVLCLSGSGGGNGGPNGVYFDIESKIDRNFKVMSLNTYPKSISLNVAMMMEIIQKNKDIYDKIFIIGWSMGGAAAIQTAYYANKFIKSDIVTGVILLASQNKEAELIGHLDEDMKIFLIHGLNDVAIPSSISQSLFDMCKCQKKLTLVPNETHNFDNSSKLHDHIINYLESFIC